ncbi:MBL fold metallo-hydrolase [Desulfosediminicola ganghwensis]|uniref:MBL fold metallo-hydrolase n=1 Tax=Desulfosediminicola ganghwensis TaxID=2569540 RepID=UPI0010AB6DE9|nr:MBL fold metallo-hydrolase [Desulfosediminicola ganghwensis]
MSIFLYTAAELFDWLTARKELVVLDVRNSTDFQRFQIESPYPFEMLNISYFDFMEIEEECVARLPRDKQILIVCAKEGSAKFVADLLEKNGFRDIGYLQDGIKSWGNLLVPVLLNPDEPYELYQFIRPGKASCSYGLGYKGELILFDPTRATDFYLNFAQERGYTISLSCETHLQADYIAGSRLLSDQTGCQVLANAGDFTGAQFTWTPLENDQILPIAADGPEIRVLFTPGHTPGSTCFLIDNRYLISGDTVFIKSVGRPDLGGKVDEWSDYLFRTLQNIQQLDPAVIILPGHFINWQEATEKLTFAAPLKQAIRDNKAIYDISNETDFLKFIKANIREQPSEYAEIRKVNANLLQVDADRAEELDLGKNECAAEQMGKG